MNDYTKETPLTPLGSFYCVGVDTVPSVIDEHSLIIRTGKKPRRPFKNVNDLFKVLRLALIDLVTYEKMYCRMPEIHQVVFITKQPRQLCLPSGKHKLNK